MLRKSSVTVVAGLALLSGTLVAGAPVAASGSMGKSSANVAPIRAIGSTGNMSPRVTSVPAIRSTRATSLRAAARCARYPASVTTVTTVEVEKKRVRKNRNNTVLVEVAANQGTPRGSVKVVVLPTTPEDRPQRMFAPLGKDGAAVVSLPTDERGKFGVRARYSPNTECSKYAPSASGVEFYRVVKRQD